ncbi:MAG: SAM-dependent chlorinase/fluorinase [Planctomycetes bacterium]|nr:SAM-dependent chlorinase/fluorinase [Planctomycetota bacterium]
MTPYWTSKGLTLLHADVRDGLRSLPEKSVQCVVTSPPYWGQRDYGVEGMIGLEPDVQQWVDEIVDVFPPETIHLVVVDPGVGSERAILGIEMNGRRFVAPDNG